MFPPPPVPMRPAIPTVPGILPAAPPLARGGERPAQSPAASATARAQDATPIPRPAAPAHGARDATPIPGSVARPPAAAAPVVPPARSVSITTAKPAAAPEAAPPKRRRSFTGESRAGERTRTETGRATHRTRKRTLDGDTTVRQAALAPAEPSEPSAVFDDLDEDTRVLQNRPGGGHDDLAAKAREAMQEKAAASAVPRPPNSEPSRDEPATEPKPAAGPGHARRAPVYDEPAHAARAHAAHAPHAAATAPVDDPTDAAEPSSGPASQNTKVWTQLPDMSAAGPVTERPAKGAPAAVQPSKKLDTLPAIRVAALATSIPGEVRLIALEGNDDAPPGAALAVLVPLTAADGEALARLFRG